MAAEQCRPWAGSQGRRRRPGGRTADDGSTLIEIVVAISLIASVIGAVLGGVMMSVKASASSLRSSQVAAVAQNVVDGIHRAPMSCDYTDVAAAAVQWYGWPATAVAVTSQRYVPGASVAVTGRWVDGACETGQVTPLLVQRLTITVTAPSGVESATVEVVKSDA